MEREEEEEIIELCVKEGRYFSRDRRGIFRGSRRMIRVEDEEVFIGRLR